MSTKKKKTDGLSWRSATHMAAFVEGHGKKLAVNIVNAGEETWTASAFELPAGDVDIAKEFPEHAHKHVGVYDHPAKAVAAAESFAAAWLNGFKATKMPDCGCDEIKAVS